MSEWISVEERLPEIGQSVLVARTGKGVRMEFRCSWGDWVCDDEYNMPLSPVTHWMPLPKHPKEG